jgi:hypothetical protein
MTNAKRSILNVAAFIMVLVTAFIDLWLALMVGALLLLGFGIWERVELRRLAHR